MTVVGCGSEPGGGEASLKGRNAHCQLALKSANAYAVGLAIFKHP